MKVIKEFCRKIVVLRTNTSAKGLNHFDKLFAQAKKDFPTLERSDVRVVQFGGDRYKRTFGIEFDLPEGAKIPKGYSELKELEYTL